MAIDAYLKLQGIQGETLDAFFRTKGVIEVQMVSMGDSERETEWIKQYRHIMDLLDPVLEEAGLKIVVAAKKKPPPGQQAPKKAKATGPHDRLRNSLDKIKYQYKTNGFGDMEALIEKVRTQRIRDLPDSEKLDPPLRFELDEELKKLLKFTRKEKEAFDRKQFKKAAEKLAAETSGNAPVNEDDEVEAGGEFKQQKLCNVVITKNFDLASMALFKKFCAYRQLSQDESTKAKADDVAIATGQVWARKSIGGFFMEWELRNLFVTDLSWSSDAGGNVVENLTLQASCVKLTYRPQDNTGALGTAVSNQWDFMTSTEDFESVSSQVFS